MKKPTPSTGAVAPDELDRQALRDRQTLQERQDVFAEDKNPGHIWKMWQICREAGQPLPPELEEYLDGVARKVLLLGEAGQKRLAPGLQEALGFEPYRGLSQLRQIYKDDRDWRLARAVYLLLFSPDGKRMQRSNQNAYETVARAAKPRVSWITVRRAWERFGNDDS